MCTKEELKKEYCYKTDKETRKKLLERMKTIHKDDPYTVSDYTEKKTRVCFCFSCPGQDEMIADQLCSGTTGKRLDKLLIFLNNARNDLFPSNNRYDYDIINASNTVHFEALTNDTEEDDSIIKTNSERKLKEYISGNQNLEYILFFGDKACILLNQLQEKEKENSWEHIKGVAVEHHLSNKGLIKITQDKYGNNIMSTYATREERTNARLEYLAKQIIDSL